MASTRLEVGGHNVTFNFEKGGQKNEVEVYDFENKGVIIEKK